MGVSDRPGCGAVYSSAIEESARLYIDHLRSELSKGVWADAASTAAGQLIRSIETALAKRESLTPASIEFARESMLQVTQADSVGFVNEYTLGWGRDDAPIIIMGTEEAYTAAPQELALWNCGCAIIWLSRGRGDVVIHLDSRAHNSRPDGLAPRCFNIHYSDWAPPPQSKHTWGCIAKVLSGDPRSEDWRSYFVPSLAAGPPRRGMGDVCHQVEISAYPAKRAHDGKFESHARTDFLSGFLDHARATAKVLLFHGGQYQGTARAELAEAFLGKRFDQLPLIEDQPRRRMWKAEHDGRIVLHTNALSRPNVDDNYLQKVADQIRELAPEAIGVSGNASLA